MSTSAVCNPSCLVKRDNNLLPHSSLSFSSFLLPVPRLFALAIALQFAPKTPAQTGMSKNARATKPVRPLFCGAAVKHCHDLGRLPPVFLFLRKLGPGTSRAVAGPAVFTALGKALDCYFGSGPGLCVYEIRPGYTFLGMGGRPGPSAR